jgi:ABC-2 type transport system permease protein
MTKFIVIALALVVFASVRISMRRRRRRRRDAVPPPHPRSGRTSNPLGDVGLVASREIRERVRGRIFRVGTVVILLGVVAAIVIPKITSSNSSPPQRVGVIDTSTSALEPVVMASARQSDTAVQVVREDSTSSAEQALRAGSIDVAIVEGGQRVLVNQPVGDKSSSASAGLVRALAVDLGIIRAYQAAGLTGAQVQQVAHAKPLPVESLQHSPTKGPAQATSTIGIILLFLMLTQYNTWILMGVMQEKASRVVEVLLATVRPIQLLGGKVLGIGLVAMGQAALIVGVALAVGAAVGSGLLHGSATLVVLSELLWLILGYAFYCWVYAAAGSMAERQDQVQTLVLPLSLPIVLGYVLALTTAGSGNPSLFFKVLAYLPPTAPFAMPVLVGLDQVQWWQFVASVVISLGGTALMAWAAAGVYRRAVLRSGQRVRLRDLTAGWSRLRPVTTTT